jgi:hypothetical protein
MDMVVPETVIPPLGLCFVMLRAVPGAKTKVNDHAASEVAGLPCESKKFANENDTSHPMLPSRVWLGIIAAWV